MITVIHGENTVLIRQHCHPELALPRPAVVSGSSQKMLNQVRHDTVTTFLELSGSEITPQRILEEYLSTDFFTPKKTIIFEIPKVFDFDFLISEIKTAQTTNDLIFFSYSTLPKSHTLIKANFQTKEFKGSPPYEFLDALFSRNKKASYVELKKLLDAQEDEFALFFLIASSFRNVLYSTFCPQLNETLHPFVKSKTKDQAKKFTGEKLKELCSFFYESDLKIKTGKLSADVFFPLLIEKLN